MKGVVTDIRGKYAAVLDETGSITRVRDLGYAIGEEITLPVVNGRSVIPKRPVYRVLAAAAGVILALNISAGVAYALPYGTVSVDVNPSIEYTINCFDYVLDVQAVNDDGQEILSQLDTKRLKHHRIDDAVVLTVEQIEREGYFEKEDASVLIATGAKSEAHAERLAASLQDRVNDDLDLPTRGISVSPSDVARAHQAGTTAGRQWEREQVPSPRPEEQPAVPAGPTPDMLPSQGPSATQNDRQEEGQPTAPDDGSSPAMPEPPKEGGPSFDPFEEEKRAGDLPPASPDFSESASAPESGRDAARPDQPPQGGAEGPDRTDPHGPQG